MASYMFTFSTPSVLSRVDVPMSILLVSTDQKTKTKPKTKKKNKQTNKQTKQNRKNRRKKKKNYDRTLIFQQGIFAI